MRSLVVFSSDILAAFDHYFFLPAGDVQTQIYFLGRHAQYLTLADFSFANYRVRWGLPDRFFTGLPVTNGTLYLCDAVCQCHTLLPHLPAASRVLVSADPSEIAYARSEQIRVVAPADIAALLTE